MKTLFRFGLALVGLLCLSTVCEASSLQTRSSVRNLFSSKKVYPEQQSGEFSGSLWGQTRPCKIKSGPQSWVFMSAYLDDIVRSGLQWQAKKAPGALLTNVAIANMREKLFAATKLESGSLVRLSFIRVLDNRVDKGLQQRIEWTYRVSYDAPRVSISKAVEGSRLKALESAYAWDYVVGSLASVLEEVPKNLEMRIAEVEIRRITRSGGLIPISWVVVYPSWLHSDDAVYRIYEQDRRDLKKDPIRGLETNAKADDNTIGRVSLPLSNGATYPSKLRRSIQKPSWYRRGRPGELVRLDSSPVTDKAEQDMTRRRVMQQLVSYKAVFVEQQEEDIFSRAARHLHTDWH